jgi:predicted nuclease of predicted toxin-antitoxin system
VKLLLDENLSPHLIRDLLATYPGSAHVRDVGLASAEDLEVWEFAKAGGFTIVSKDEDFHQRSFAFGHPPKVVWIQLGNCTTDDVLNLLVSRRAEMEEFEAHREASLLIVP